MEALRTSLLAVALVSSLVVLPACSQPVVPEAAHTPSVNRKNSLEAVANEIAEHASRNDTAYFADHGASPETIPELIAQISRSGLATNYADHFVADGQQKATLNYHLTEDVSPPTFYGVELRLVNNQWQIKWISLVW